MAKDKRESRKKLSKQVDITKPITPLELTKLGTDDDPCFGKHYDLTADECKRCGDCNLCSIVFNSKTEKLRGKEEKNNRFKDLELHQKETKEYRLITRLLEKNVPSIRIVKRLVKDFNMDKDQAKKLLKSIKK